METIPLDVKRYSEIISEIERFIETEKKKPTTIKGKVISIDLSDNLISVKLSLANPKNLSRGSLVLIKENTYLSVEIRGIVNENYNSILKIEIKSNPSRFENKEIIIDTSKTNVILKRLENIIKNIKEDKLSLENKKILNFLMGENKPEYNQEKVSFISKELNENQREAVVKSVCANDFHLIIGPPGTGKTYVIEELIHQFSKRSKKLLVTAWTNLAIDNIIKRLENKESLEIVRIGPISEIDPAVKEYAIDTKMKKHRDWEEVERYQKTIIDFYNLLPTLRDKMNLKQEDINQIKNKRDSLNKELNSLIIEEEKYNLIREEGQNIIKDKNLKNKDLVDISQINHEMDVLNKKSEDYLSLSEDILQIRELQVKIPKIKEIQKLKKLTRNLKFSILKTRISSFFSKQNKGRFKKLTEDYEKNKKRLEDILELQRRNNSLKNKCNREIIRLYSGSLGHPDEDSLNHEFKNYKILEDQYLPAFKKQEISDIERQIFEVDQEVFTIYLESLKAQIDLKKIKIKNLNTEMYIQIDCKNNLEKQYTNLRSSLDFCKKNKDRLMKRIKREIIEDADIIIATAISSCHSLLDDTNFDVMIMEEASQVASFMSLLPLSKCKKFILVGDNKQLQPIGEENISKEMNLSLFNRLFGMYPDVSTLLTTQYRMHEAIARISNEIFYEGKLKTSKKVAKEILNLRISNPQFLNPKIPVTFIDTSKVEYYEEEVGTGCSNIKEAEYVAYIVSLFIKNKIKNNDIGIITPYVKQKLLIEKFLEDIKIKDVEVNTVHRFQGREKDIIIMSFAKSKKYSFPQYMLKFIENETLVNVSITRAKKKLILIGNSETLSQSKLLDKVMNKIGKENGVVL